MAIEELQAENAFLVQLVHDLRRVYRDAVNSYPQAITPMPDQVRDWWTGVYRSFVATNREKPRGESR